MNTVEGDVEGHICARIALALVVAGHIDVFTGWGVCRSVEKD